MNNYITDDNILSAGKAAGFKVPLDLTASIDGLPLNACVNHKTGKDVESLADAKVRATVQYLINHKGELMTLDDRELRETLNTAISKDWERKKDATIIIKAGVLHVIKQCATRSHAGTYTPDVFTETTNAVESDMVNNQAFTEDDVMRFKTLLWGVNVLLANAGISYTSENLNVVGVNVTGINALVGYYADIDILYHADGGLHVAMIDTDSDITGSDVLFCGGVGGITHIGDYLTQQSSQGRVTSKLQQTYPVTIASVCKLLCGREEIGVQRFKTDPQVIAALRMNVAAAHWRYGQYNLARFLDTGYSTTLTVESVEATTDTRDSSASSELDLTNDNDVFAL